MHEPDGYPPANDVVLEAAARADGLLIPFCRVNPHDERRARGGALRSTPAREGSSSTPGPRSSRSIIPTSATLVALADERRLPMLIHAGRGIPASGCTPSSSPSDFPTRG